MFSITGESWTKIDLLGNIFEKSIGDVTELAAGGRVNARAAFGVYFTSSRIAKFLSQSVVAQSLSDREDLTRAMNKVVTASNDSIREAGANEVLDAIKSVRLADLTCGSGVFLIAALESLLSPYRKALEAQSRSGSLFPAGCGLSAV
jgi:type I restriction-modification system DNA methylase subunit